MVPIKTNIASKSNYGSSRALSTIKYIVIHYTANDGDTDESNAKYFKTGGREASAHYFVDDDSITQSVPDNYIAWHCGAKSYKHAKCRNTNSIGIEICDDVRNGSIYPSAKTIENVLELTKSLMKKYNIPKENVVRHYDVTGKSCPAYWVDNSKWKSEFHNKLSVETPFLVRVTASSLNIRSGPGTNYKKVGAITDKGVYTITSVTNGWGKLKSGAGYISLSYTTIL